MYGLLWFLGHGGGFLLFLLFALCREKWYWEPRGNYLHYSQNKKARNV